MLCVFSAGLAQFREVFPGIVELEGGKPAPAALSDDCPLGHGTRGSKLHHKAPGRDDDQAAQGGLCGPQHEQHGAVQGLGNPRNRGVIIKPQHGEQGCNDAFKRFAVAFDGQVPVKVIFQFMVLPCKEQNRNTNGT